MKTLLFTQFRRPPKQPEVMDPLTQTESRGYLPPKQQIENLIKAGERLIAYRQEMYDFPDGKDVDDAAEDPTRRPGYDLADASRDAQDASARLRAQAKAGKAEGSKDTADPRKVDPEQSSEVSSKVDKKKNEKMVE